MKNNLPKTRSLSEHIPFKTVVWVIYQNSIRQGKIDFFRNEQYIGPKGTLISSNIYKIKFTPHYSGDNAWFEENQLFASKEELIASL